MADSETETQYKQAFIKRVKAAREATGMKQWQVAEALGMPQDKYKQYETRTLLPHHLIARFCILTRITTEWLLTGRGPKPPNPPVVDSNWKPLAVKQKRKSTMRIV
jgi:transcriptional regulator with XRE-family HTH domain